MSVTDYCSGVWGFRDFNKGDMIQNRAVRYFLGVHRFTPLLAISGDMGTQKMGSYASTMESFS